MTTTKFIPGQTYFDRSACDHNCIFTMSVESRTEKTLKVRVNGRAKTLRVSVSYDVEQVKPFGSYSMCSIMRADKVYSAVEAA